MKSTPLLTAARRQALLEEAKRVELEAILKYRPAELERRRILLPEARRAVFAPPTTQVERWARQTGRGGKKGTPRPSRPGEIEGNASGFTRSRFAAMLAAQFITHDGLERSAGITRGINEMHRAVFGYVIPIHSRLRREVSRELNKVLGDR